jgi:hypothetical protein
MCNSYSLTKGQAAIIALVRAMRDRTGNLPPMPGVFPDFLAPIARTGADGAACHTASIQRLRNGPQRRSASPLYLPDDGKHVRGVPIRVVLYGLRCSLGGITEPPLPAAAILPLPTAAVMSSYCLVTLYAPRAASRLKMVDCKDTD